MTKRILLVVLALMLATSMVVVAGCSPAEEDPDKLVMALVPSSTAETLMDDAQPLADMLSEKLGLPVEVEVPLNYTAVVEGVDAGTIDIAMLNSFGYVLSHEMSDTVCILKSVRYGSATYHGQFLVMADSDIQSFADLKGKRIAFVDPASTSGYIFAATTLKANGIDPEADMDSIFAGGHDKAIVALLNGQVDVAVSFDDARTTVQGDFPNVMEDTRIIGTTEEIPNDTVSVRAGLSDELTQKIKTAFLEIADTEDGQETLYNIYEINGLESAEDSEYDPVREAAEGLGLDLKELMGE